MDYLRIHASHAEAVNDFLASYYPGREFEIMSVGWDQMQHLRGSKATLDLVAAFIVGRESNFTYAD